MKKAFLRLRGRAAVRELWRIRCHLAGFLVVCRETCQWRMRGSGKRTAAAGAFHLKRASRVLTRATQIGRTLG
jgi:hypothetical protein